MNKNLIFTIALAAACGGNFDPDLSEFETDSEGMSDSGTDDGTSSGMETGTGDESGTGETDTGDETGDGTDTGGDMCGDGEAQGDEECDGLDLRGAECSAFTAPQNGNFTGGQLACDDDCTLNFDGCFYCGDGMKNGPGEECDGADLDGLTCEGEGFDGGDISCTDQCEMDFGCANCEGDPDGFYGDGSGDCGGHNSMSGQWPSNEDWWRVCIPSCAEDADCVDPNLEICQAQPSCELGNICKIVCTIDEECPSGMFCMLQDDPGFCVWEQ